MGGPIDGPAPLGELRRGPRGWVKGFCVGLGALGTAIRSSLALVGVCGGPHDPRRPPWGALDGRSSAQGVHSEPDRTPCGGPAGGGCGLTTPWGTVGTPEGDFNTP